MMSSFKNIEIEIIDGIATIWLNRPEARNAMNPDLLRELIEGFNILQKTNEIYAILLRGRGKSFCAGADIKWLEQSANQDYEKNYKESELLSDCFKTIYETNKVVISLIHGHSFGGGLGLMAACDFTFATEETTFGLPELKLGVFSAVITPYLLTRMSLPALKYKIFTGESFSVKEAKELGIVDMIFKDTEALENHTFALLNKINENSQRALSAGKILFRELNMGLMNQENIKKSILTLTDLKISAEARNRMLKFINKN